MCTNSHTYSFKTRVDALVMTNAGRDNCLAKGLAFKKFCTSLKGRLLPEKMEQGIKQLHIINTKLKYLFRINLKRASNII